LFVVCMSEGLGRGVSPVLHVHRIPLWGSGALSLTALRERLYV
jgi:hypothetical protein